jgi:hypothetical protein
LHFLIKSMMYKPAEPLLSIRRYRENGWINQRN